MPAEIVFAEFMSVFGASSDDGFKGIEAKMKGFAELATKRLILDSATQGPDGVDKGEVGEFLPGGA